MIIGFPDAVISIKVIELMPLRGVTSETPELPSAYAFPEIVSYLKTQFSFSFCIDFLVATVLKLQVKV